jgi:outer membrane protein assembly factor BamA
VILTLNFIFNSVSFARPGMTGGGAEGEAELIYSESEMKEWKSYDGKVVHSIQVNGLVRTRLQSILWLMGTKTSGPFSGEQLGKDLQVLYNTGNLYDLKGQVQNDEAGGVLVTISLRDKWTLFPVLGAQGGGGSSTLGGGVFESNLLGYMVNSSVLIWTFNGTTSYDINANQEYFAGTDTMWSLDWQDNIEPETVHNYNGNVVGQFAWRRQQKEVMLGTHFAGPWRFLAYASVFQDSVFNNDGAFNINIPYQGLQQRFYPKAIFGKVDWTNYQEYGFELTMQPTAANLIGGGPQYQALEVDYKQVWKSGPKDKDNIAIYLSTSHLTNGGPNFIYQVGGYYNVRGYSDYREFGRDVAFTNLEWRPYLARHRWELLDLDLMVVQGCLFTDFGSAWGDPSLTGESAAQNFHLLWSAGAGLRINMVKFAGAILRLDWAQTLSPNEGVGFSFGVGQFF